MKRLFQISFDTLLISILSIALWILLGVILGKDISNVFSLTYPLQFFFAISETLFGKGPNVTAKKLHDKKIVDVNIIFGTIVVGMLTLILCLNVDTYINLLNMDVAIYHNYCIYSIVWMYLCYTMQLLTQKLYFEDKNTESNIINLMINICNFVSIVLLSIFAKDWIAIPVTLVLDSVLVIFVFVRYVKIDGLCALKLKDNIKYSSFSLIRNVAMFLIYIFGFRESFSYGTIYLATINFESLVTDAQWDMLYSIDTASKIDLAEDKFEYKPSLKNAYKLIGILIGSSCLMSTCLYWFYKPNLSILIILLGVQFVDMLLDPIKTFRLNYLQIQENDSKHNIYYIVMRVIRLACSFIPTVFCTYIGQGVSMICLLVYALYQCRHVSVFKVREVKNGTF